MVAGNEHGAPIEDFLHDELLQVAEFLGERRARAAILTVAGAVKPLVVMRRLASPPVSSNSLTSRSGDSGSV